jgi:assimilatory nitrate reductase catalytic subunit
MVEVRTTCPYCGVGCGVIVDQGSIKGDPGHPANFGRLCSKGAALLETLDDRDRLLRPRIDGREAGWDEALDLVARRFTETIAEHGPDSVAFYASGQFLTEDYYVANKLMKGFIGSGNIDTNSRLCMASTVAGQQRAFGEDVVPGSYEDWDETDLAILVGSNTAWCHPVLYRRLTDARARRGTFVVVIDPRRTASCEIADLHLPLAPGTDVALFDGLLVHLADSGRLNRPWIEAHTTGFAQALETARRSAGSLSAVASITGLPDAAIAAFYERFASTERAMTVFSQGVNQSSSGTDKVNAIINCHLATGRIGRPGTGPFSVTGQPNAMGGREVGGLANQLAAHLRFDEPADLERLSRFWKAPQLTKGPGLKAIDLFDAVLDGRVRAIWIMATNPAASLPRADVVRRALAAAPFVVVSDCWDTDTSQLAHVVLPTATWGEKDGTVTNSERRISRQRAFRKAPGEAKPDWWMVTQVARRMGWTEAFDYRRPSEIFREHAALSGFENDGARLFDIGALATLGAGDYDRLAPVQWPLPATRPDDPGGRLFGAGGFSTPDRRARFVATAWTPRAAKTGRRHSFLLNTGRARDQWHTMTRTGRVARLMEHQSEPYVDIHPADARKIGVSTGDLMRVDSEHGACVLPARVTDAQRAGEIFVAMHWTDRFGSAGPVNRLVGAARDPLSGQPELKATAVALAPVPTLWRALLVGAAAPALEDCYRTRIPVGGCDAWELRGWSRLGGEPELRGLAGRLLGSCADAERATLIDADRGIWRFARLSGGTLQACLLVSTDRRYLTPDRTAVAALVGKPFDEAARRLLFGVGRAEASPETSNRSVCACFSVGRSVIERAIAECGLTSVAEIGAIVRAGSNCGSCVPELEQILRARRAAAA